MNNLSLLCMITALNASLCSRNVGKTGAAEIKVGRIAGPAARGFLMMLSSIAQNSQLSLLGVTWEQFELLEAAFAGIGGVRFVYLDGVLSKYINYHDQYDAVIEFIGELKTHE